MAETHPHTEALDSFDNRIPTADREGCVAGRPHADAVFDWEAWSRHGRDWNGNAPVSDGFRFVYACEHYPDRCPDAIGDMAACKIVEEPHPNVPQATRTRAELLDPDRHPAECPDCGSRVYRLARAWQVPLRPWDVGMPPFHYDGPGVSD